LEKLKLGVRLYVSSSEHNKSFNISQDIVQYISDAKQQTNINSRSIKEILCYSVSLLGKFLHFNECEELIDILSSEKEPLAEKTLSALQIGLLIYKIRAGHFTNSNSIYEKVKSFPKDRLRKIWIEAANYFTEQKNFNEAYQGINFLGCSNDVRSQIVCLSRTITKEVISSSGNNIDIKTHEIQRLFNDLQQPRTRYYTLRDSMIESQLVFQKSSMEKKIEFHLKNDSIKKIQAKLCHSAISVNLIKDLAYLGYVNACEGDKLKAQDYFARAYSFYKEISSGTTSKAKESKIYNQLAVLFKFQVLSGYTYIDQVILQESEGQIHNLGANYVESVRESSKVLTEKLKEFKQDDCLKVNGFIASILNANSNEYFKYLYHWELIFLLIESASLQCDAALEVAKILQWQDQEYLTTIYNIK
ncbi:MAG: hypothetical protein AAFN93_19230, partial [Bacteroidota bacterium]